MSTYGCPECGGSCIGPCLARNPPDGGLIGLTVPMTVPDPMTAVLADQYTRLAQLYADLAQEAAGLRAERDEARAALAELRAKIPPLPVEVAEALSQADAALARTHGGCLTTLSVQALSDSRGRLHRAVSEWAVQAPPGSPAAIEGAPGVRDPDAPCDDYEPGAPRGLCMGDGHYLCRECVHLDLVERAREEGRGDVAHD